MPDTVISFSFENIVTIFAMVLIGWIILTFVTNYFG